MANHLWLNRGNGTFADEALLAGTAFNADGQPEGSMGLAVGDPDNDGDDDIVVTTSRAKRDAFYRNLGRGRSRSTGGRRPWRGHRPVYGLGTS